MLCLEVWRGYNGMKYRGNKRKGNGENERRITFPLFEYLGKKERKKENYFSFV